MTSKIVLTAAVAGAMSAMTVAYTAPAHALELGVGSKTGVGVSTGTSNDASGGILARNNTSINAGADVNTRMRGANTRMNSGVNSNVNTSADTDTDNSYADTDQRMRDAEGRQSGSRVDSDISAGADTEADLRNQIRNTADVDVDADANTSVDVGESHDTRQHSGLFGLSSSTNSRVTGSMND